MYDREIKVPGCEKRKRIFFGWLTSENMSSAPLGLIRIGLQKVEGCNQVCVKVLEVSSRVCSTMVATLSSMGLLVCDTQQ